MSLHVESNTLRSLIATICAPFRASTNRFMVLSALAAIAFCSGSVQSQTTQYASGAFTWGTDSKWASSSGGSYVDPWTSGNDAVLEGTAGTVSIAASGVTAHNITFNKTGFTISANTLTLNGTSPTLSMEAGTNATISSIIAGSAGMAKAGSGTLNLNKNTSTFTGDVNINAGTVSLNSGASQTAGNASSSSLGALNVARNININTGGTLYVNNIAVPFGEIATTMTAVININGGTLKESGNVTPIPSTITLDGGTMIADGGQANGSFIFNGDVIVTGGKTSYLNDTGVANCNYDLSNQGSRITRFNVGNGSTLMVNSHLANGWGTLSSLIKTGAGTMVLNTNNLYTGRTTVSNGTLQVNGSLMAASAVTVVAGGTLSGTGTINGVVTNGVGGTLAPGGASIGTLTNKSTLTLLAGSTNVFRINKAGAALTSDRVTGMTGVAYGGTLSVTATGDALAIGDTFTLFTKASGSYSGSFSTTNLPALPDDREWNTATLISDGSIAVMVKGGQVPAGTPTFNPDSGGYFGAQTVTISCGTPGSTVFYTTDGSTPTNTSPSGVAGSASAIVSVPAPTNITIKAYATNSGMLDSAVSSATYTTVSGTTATWTNLVSGSWSVAGNWQSGVVGQGSGITADFSTLTLPGNTAVTLGSALTIGNLVFGDVGSARTWTVNADIPARTLTLVGTSKPVITVNNQTTTIEAVLAGTNGMSKTGAGTLTLSGANTLTGDVNVDGGTVSLNTSLAGNSNPTTSSLGNLMVSRNFNVYTNATLLSTCVAFGEVAVQMSAVINIIGGTVINNGAGAVLVLNNVNLNGGTMSAQGGHATANFQLNGTMSVTGTEPSLMTSTAAANIYGLRSTIFNVSDVTTSPAADLTISGVLGNGFGGSTAGFIKTGAGTMLLTTNNTYTGATTVSNGTLQVSGSIALSSATVMTNAVLCGTGTLGSNVTVNAGGILAAGTTNTVGGAAIAGTLTLQDNSRLLVDVQSLSQNDLITVAGNVTLTSTLKLEVSGGVTRSGTWTIIQSTGGTISGTLPTTVLGGTKGATLAKSSDSKQLLLTFLPQGTMIRVL